MTSASHGSTCNNNNTIRNQIKTIPIYYITKVQKTCIFFLYRNAALQKSLRNPKQVSELQGSSEKHLQAEAPDSAFQTRCKELQSI